MAASTDALQQARRVLADTEEVGAYGVCCHVGVGSSGLVPRVPQGCDATLVLGLVCVAVDVAVSTAMDITTELDRNRATLMNARKNVRS